MSTLTGTKIKDTYPGLIKTSDNGIVGATEKQLTDGLGNGLPVSAGTSGVSFTGGVDFSSATVTGLTDNVGLVSGAATDSMQSAASLTTNPANASLIGNIALGDGATVCTITTTTYLCSGGIAIGDGAVSQLNSDYSFGAGNRPSIAIGSNACSIAQGYGQTTAIGDDSYAEGGTAVGGNSYADSSTAYGNNSRACGSNSIAIGNSVATGYASIAIGCEGAVNAGSFGCGAIAIGNKTCIATGNDASIVLGNCSRTCALGAVALGQSVTAAKADTVTVKELETCVAGGGIYLTTPDGTAQPKLTVDNTCALLIGGNPVGAAGLVNGTGTDSLKNADNLVTGATLANGACSVVLGDSAKGYRSYDVTIGYNTCTNGLTSNIAIGNGAKAGDSGQGAYRSIAIGCGAQSISSSDGIALGNTSFAKFGNAISIGTGSAACGTAAIAIGRNSDVLDGNHGGVAIGESSVVSATCAIAIGQSSTASGACSIALGNAATITGASSIAIGNTANGGTTNCSITIGFGATTTGSSRGISIGQSANAGTSAVALGRNSIATGTYSVAIGPSSSSAYFDGVAIGRNSVVGAAGSVALGLGVTAAKTNTVSVTELETQLAGGGITMKSPNGTEYKLTVSDAGALVIT